MIIYTFFFLKGPKIKIATYICHRHTQLPDDGFCVGKCIVRRALPGNLRISTLTGERTQNAYLAWNVKRIKGTKIYMDKNYSTFYLSWISINKGSSWWLSLWNNVFRSASTQEIIPTHFLMNIPQIHILQQNEPWYLST